MSEITYICNDNQSNKFWSYNVTNVSVYIKWGRIGGTSDEQTKDFGSSGELQKFISSKVREKEKKGYKLVTKEKLKEETKVAHSLGPQNKIKRMLFVSRKDNELVQLDNYDSKQYVYVEILNSWSKEMTRLLLSKDDTWMLNKGVSESGRTLHANGIEKLTHGSSFANTVRELLKKMAETVIEVLKSVKFGAVGSRSLFDDENDAEAPEVQSALSSIDYSGFEMSIVTKFASMGNRVLEL